MKRWQRRARLTIAVFGVVFAVFVARELKRRRGEERRSKRQIQRLGLQLERRSRQLRSIRESRWWKMRPRLPKPRRAGH